MKKLLALLLALTMLLTLCACGGNPAADDAQAPDAAENAPGGMPEAPVSDGEPEEAPEKSEEDGAAPEEDEQASEGSETEDPGTPDETKTSEPAETQLESDPKPAETQPKPEPKPAETQPEPAPAPEPEPEAAPVDKKAVAQSMKGRPVSELYAAIGKPISSSYAPSCLIDGDDGELIYDGFTVYTERDATSETVYEVF